jgi:hypothetical protein
VIDKGLGAGWNNPPRGSAIARKLDIDKFSYLIDIAADLNFLLSKPLPG